MIHPRFVTLSRFEEGSLSPSRRRRIAAHLAGCIRCRAIVGDLRRMREHTRTLPVPSLSGDTWESVVRRRAAGDRVILPIAEPSPTRPSRRATPAIAAAAIAAVLALATALLPTTELEAEASELQLSPERPRAGEEILVTYRATAKLDGSDRLVLRAQLSGPSRALLPRYGEVAVLTRTGGRTFRGSFRLPDSILFAAFAVESPDGESVDYDPVGWNLVVHGSDGRPLLAGLARELEHQEQWSADRAMGTAREMVYLYPDSLVSWWRLYGQETSRSGVAERDSVATIHRNRLPVLEGHLVASRLTPDRMASLIFYAEALGDTTTARRWRERLIADYPDDPSAIQQRVFVISRTYREDLPARLAALEDLWTEVGSASEQLPFTAFQTAQRSGDAEMLLRWGSRLEEREPALAAMVAVTFVQAPALRDAAIVRARQQVHRFAESRSEDRPLSHTVADQQREYRKAQGFYLGQLGRLLLAQNYVAAGIDSLQKAMETVWDVDLFRTIAEIKLAQGDTLAALPVLARIAADPSTGESLADSVRARVGTYFDGERWADAVKAGREEMGAHIWDQATNRPMRGPVRLLDGDGRARELAFAGSEPVLVAFWSRYCTPSAVQLDRLQSISEDLRRRGVPVIAITDEAPSAELRAFLAENGYTFPVYHDTERTARRAFDNAATPRYLVLDTTGRIRFESYAPDDVLRQVEVLGAGR